MGRLYDIRLAIEKVIKERKLDSVKIKGQISLEMGFLINLIREDSPDDGEKIKKLEEAAGKILDHPFKNKAGG